MTQTLAGCGPAGQVVSSVQWKPGILIPAIIATLACGPSYLAKAFTKDGCAEGDKVSVAQDGWAKWVGKAEVQFRVLNPPDNHLLCVLPLTAAQATAFAADNKVAWSDFNRWKAAHNG